MKPASLLSLVANYNHGVRFTANSVLKHGSGLHRRVLPEDPTFTCQLKTVMKNFIGVKKRSDRLIPSGVFATEARMDAY